jgi:hypothetical protein
VAPRTGLDDPPTRARHTVTIFAVTLAVITYVDGVCIAQAAPTMQTELGLTAIQLGWAFTAFTWAYALFEIPGGWARRSPGPAARAHARRRLVVVLHGCNWVGVEPGVPTRDAPALRHGRGWLLSESNTRVHDLAAPAGARARAGHPLAGCAMGRRLHATVGGVDSCTTSRGDGPSRSSAAWGSCGRGYSFGGIGMIRARIRRSTRQSSRSCRRD